MSALAIRDPFKSPFFKDILGDEFMRDFFDLGQKYYVADMDASQTTFEFVVPGVKKEDISVTLDNSNLYVEYTDRKGGKCRDFRFVGRCQNPQAKLVDGILTVTVERPEKQRIEVKVE